MQYAALIVFIVIAIIENLGKAQRRATQAREREERARRAGGGGVPQPTPAPQLSSARTARPAGRTRQAARRAPVTWREPGPTWPSRRDAGGISSRTPVTVPVFPEAIDTALEEQYTGSMGHISGEGISAEWDIPADHPEWELGDADPFLPVRVPALIAGPAADGVRMLTGQSEGGSGAATAIVLSEVLGGPRAYRPWRGRTGRRHPMT